MDAEARRKVGLIVLALIAVLLCFFDCSTARFGLVAPAHIVLCVAASRLGRPVTMALACTALIAAAELWLLTQHAAEADGISARAIVIALIWTAVLVLRWPMGAMEKRSDRSRDANSERLASIAESAAHTAHAFNNSIGAIMGFASFLQDSLPANSEEHDFALRILASAERSKDLIEDVRKLSRMAFASQSGSERRAPQD